MWSWILSGLNLIIFWITGTNPRLGWLMSIGMQGLWILYSLSTKQWGFLLGVIPFSIVYWRNYKIAVRKEGSLNNEN